MIFNYVFHLIHALLLFLTIKYNYIPHLGFISLIGCMIGFKIPDLDKKNTIPSQQYPIISTIIRLFCKHRGFTHSIVSVVITYFLFKKLEIILQLPELSIGVLIGYISHLLADSSTPMGIPLLWPFKLPLTKKKNFKIFIINNYPILAKLAWIILFIYLIINSPNFNFKLNTIIK